MKPIIPLDPVTMTEAVETIVGWAQEPTGSRIVVTPNFHYYFWAERDPRFRAWLSQADLRLCDSRSLRWLYRKAGVILPEVLPGTDLLAMVLRRCETLQLPVFFVGATPWVVLGAVIRTAPQLQFAYVCPTDWRNWVTDNTGIWHRWLVIVNLGLDSVEAAYTLKSQHVQSVVVCVGGALNLLSGDIRRAPPWIRRLGVEGIWRAACEPRRLLWRYMLDGARFLWAATVIVLSSGGGGNDQC